MSLYSTDRPEFIERLAKLAGGTTWRQPLEGHGTKSDHLPDAHAIATALGFARKGADDVGPDVAYCLAVRSDSYRHKSVSTLVRVLTDGKQTRSSGDLYTAIDAAWDSVVWDRAKDRPPHIPEKAWDAALLVGIRVLHERAWDALAEAERRYRRAA